MNQQVPLILEYEISGLEVHSEIVRDQIVSVPDGSEYRAIMIRSSCNSKRWGRRTQEHSFSAKLPLSNLLPQLEKCRFEAAEAVVRVELGLVAEPVKSGPLAVTIFGPDDRKINTFAVMDVSQPRTRVQPAVVQMLGLHASDQMHWEENADHRWHSIPLYHGRVQFHTHSSEALLLPTEMNIPCILGGEFVQQALKDKPYLLQETLIEEHFRTLLNVARCKKKHVLILGKYGDHIQRLEQLKRAVAQEGYIGLILSDWPDIEEQSLPEKLTTFATMCRFVICDDVASGGHIDELEILRSREFTTALLRPNGKASTAMQSHYSIGSKYMKSFDYHDDPTLKQALSEVLVWAEQVTLERGSELNALYDWRSGQKVLW